MHCSTTRFKREQEFLGESQNTAGACHQTQERLWLQVGLSEPQFTMVTPQPTTQQCLGLAAGTNAEAGGPGSIPLCLLFQLLEPWLCLRGMDKHPAGAVCKCLLPSAPAAPRALLHGGHNKGTPSLLPPSRLASGTKPRILEPLLPASAVTQAANRGRLSAGCRACAQPGHQTPSLQGCLLTWRSGGLFVLLLAGVSWPSKTQR